MVPLLSVGNKRVVVVQKSRLFHENSGLSHVSLSQNKLLNLPLANLFCTKFVFSYNGRQRVLKFLILGMRLVVNSFITSLGNPYYNPSRNSLLWQTERGLSKREVRHASTSCTALWLEQHLLGNNRQCWVAYSFCVVHDWLLQADKLMKLVPIQGLHDAVRTYTCKTLPRSLVSFLYGTVWRKTTKPAVGPFSSYVCDGKMGFYTMFFHLSSLLLIYFIARFENSTECVF